MTSSPLRAGFFGCDPRLVFRGNFCAGPVKLVFTSCFPLSCHLFISVSVDQDIRELDGLDMHVSFVVGLKTSKFVPASAIQLSWTRGVKQISRLALKLESRKSTTSTCLLVHEGLNPRLSSQQ